MKRTLLLIAVIGFFAQDLWGQATSVQDGPWNSTGTWDCGCVPDFTGGVITLAHRVNIPNGFSVTADQIEFDNSVPFGGVTGSLYVDAGGTLIINNGAGSRTLLVVPAPNANGLATGMRHTVPLTCSGDSVRTN